MNGRVLLYFSPSWTDRDKASLHKVAGKTLQQHGTCQQPHRALGTLIIIGTSCLLFLHLSMAAHSFYSLKLFTAFTPFCPHFGYFLFLWENVFWNEAKKHAGRATVFACLHRVYNPLDVVPLLLHTQEGSTHSARESTLWMCRKVSKDCE